MRSLGPLRTLRVDVCSVELLDPGNADVGTELTTRRQKRAFGNQLLDY